MGFLGTSGGEQRTVQTTTQELSPQQQQLLDLVVPRAASFVSQPPVLFPRSQIQPFDPLQEQAQQQFLNTAAGPATDIAQAAGAAQQFLSGPVLFPESNPALAAATDAAIRPLIETFEERVLPAVRSEALLAGGVGGSRQGIAEGLAAKELLAQTGDVSATLQSEAFGQGLEALTRGQFAAPAILEAAFLPASAVEAVGTQRRDLAQSFLTEDAARFAADQLREFEAAQLVAELAFGIGGGTTTSAATGATTARTSPISQALGLGAAGLALGGNIGGIIGALAGLIL